MVIVSDTNLLSSLAAANALFLLLQLFPDDTIHIPPAVEQELQTALAFGKQHIKRVFATLERGTFHRIELTIEERLRLTTLPRQLHAGEREGIVLCQARKVLFLCNDGRAIRYCKANSIKAIDLPTILRLFWIRQVTTKDRVKALIEEMVQIERLTLSDSQRTMIFAPHHPRERKQRK